MHYDEIRNIVRKLRRDQTKEEKMLWEYLRKRRLNGYRFLRQYPLFYDRCKGDQRYIMDKKHYLYLKDWTHPLPPPP